MAASLKGFAAPLNSTGDASLYGPPPWNFAGRSLNLVADCNQDEIAKLVPAPLEPIAGAPVRFTIHDLVCDIGLGADFAAHHPERTLVREAVVALAVKFAGMEGFYDPFLYCDSDAEIAVGREMFGWPQLGASIWLTPPDPINGVTEGDQMTGKVSRLGAPVFHISMEVADKNEPVKNLPAFSTFYTMRILPNPETGSRKVEIFQSYMQNIVIHDPRYGAGKLDIMAPELQALQASPTGPARCNAIRWTKNISTCIHSQNLAILEPL